MRLISHRSEEWNQQQQQQGDSWIMSRNIHANPFKSIIVCVGVIYLRVMLRCRCVLIKKNIDYVTEAMIGPSIFF